MSLKILLATLVLCSLKPLINSQVFESPCPNVFEYTGRGNKGEWHGKVKLFSSTDLFGVWIQLTFDKPFLKLENAFGEVVTTNGSNCFIEKPNFKLQSNTPHRFSFILKYNPNETPPMLVSFKLNGKLVCPATSPLIYPSLNNICGTVTKYSEAKKVNGELTYSGSFPWHAGLYDKRIKRFPQLCAGSLISAFYVITLARCVIHTRELTPFQPKDIAIALGRHLNNQADRNQQLRNVSEIIPNPSYKPGADLHNIALLKLSSTAIYSDYVIPICLWQESNSLNSLLNNEGTVIGFGIDPESKRTESLIQSKMLIIPNEKCITSLPIFSADSYCARYKEGTIVCNGQAGSGMVFLRSNNLQTNTSVWQLRGLASVGALSAHSKCNTTSDYLSFVDITNYLDWIRNIIL